jgi:hypothetical protein
VYLDIESKELRQSVGKLKEIDFELAYLALLTCEGLKPLSRWEKPLDGGGLELLKQMGLHTKEIPRTVKTGKIVSETIFSKTPGYIQLYEKQFSGKPIDKSAATTRFEGFLFGFPPCCVDEYIRRPYAANGLAAEEQKILFYWACKDCKITETLLQGYRRIHEYVEKC